MLIVFPLGGLGLLGRQSQTFGGDSSLDRRLLPIGGNVIVLFVIIIIIIIIIVILIHVSNELYE